MSEGALRHKLLLCVFLAKALLLLLDWLLFHLRQPILHSLDHRVHVLLHKNKLLVDFVPAALKRSVFIKLRFQALLEELR